MYGVALTKIQKAELKKMEEVFGFLCELNP